MAYTTVHLVRHGQVDNPGHVLYERMPGFHLSGRGRRMAEATARFIASRSDMCAAAAIYSSPLERTQETAEAIIAAVNMQRRTGPLPPLCLHTDSRIIEAGNEFRGRRIGHGEGALWKNGNWRLVLNLWRPSWGESYKAIAGRVSDFVYEQVDRYPRSSVIAVTHESPIWSFRHMLEKGRPEHNMLLRRTALASVTSLTFETGTHRVMNIAYCDPAAGVS